MSAKTTVRPDPASTKTLLYVEGDAVFTESGGKRLFTIDKDGFISEAAGGKRLIYVGDGDVRRESEGGLRLAVWDGPELRRTPGGPRLALADSHDRHGQEIRPEPGFKRFFYLEGDELNPAQLTAVMLKLKPELFTLTKAEEKAAADAIKEGGDWTERQAAPQAQVGTFQTMTGSGPWMRKKFTMSWGNEHFHVQSKDGDVLNGAAIKFSSSGEHLIGAMGPGICQFGLFKYKNGKYSGRWIQQLGSAKADTDSWKTAIAAEGAFASKLGNLKLEKVDLLFQDDSTVLSVEGDKGQKGFALRYGNEANGGGLIVVLGAGGGVFYFDASGAMLNGEYYAGPDQEGRLMMDLQTQ